MISCILPLSILATQVLSVTSEHLSPTNVPTSLQVPTSSNSTATILGTRYGETPPDLSEIQFQYEDSKEVGNTIWDAHVEKIIARGVLQLALQMDYVLAGEQQKLHSLDNIVFSPANIAAALAMVMLGAVGRTFTEIANVLGLVSGVDISANSDELHYHFGRLIRKLQSHPDSQMSTLVTMAGAVFVQEGYPIEEKFFRDSWQIYGSEILNLDFYRHGNEARDVINRWVSNRTMEHITNILDYPPPPSTKVIIATALYFNGAWEFPFPYEQTKWKPFYIDGKDETDSKEIIQVIMMATGADFQYYHDNQVGCQVVGLPYKDHTATMYLVLPDEPGVEALKRLQHSLTVNHLHQLSDLATEKTLIIAVPRMQLESTIHLKDPLKLLGVQSLFDPYHADLSKISKHNPQLVYQYAHYPTSSNAGFEPANAGIQGESEKIEFRASDTIASNNPGLYAEDVIHKVTVDITETGTEASAASVVSLTRDGSHKVVRFERPFFFFIRHKTTGVILFWGTVIKPTPNQKTYKAT